MYSLRSRFTTRIPRRTVNRRTSVRRFPCPSSAVAQKAIAPSNVVGIVYVYTFEDEVNRLRRPPPGDASRAS